ncbi:GPO family capsid scaffolding protein [Enterovibrio sp. ZSDZ42]|uniref:GPO family capsid scaffolding protein n=1 Tax=Enterovibrio gelatinilyticus TaxID=2899819 RepID=A0ABT5QWX9_9GAMM|nr:GPO family capsid scaffolding protein [Enterovibrio sp. ZSDZ42]MDD1792529.1 GPO family capsid scaffolding protein [Enterovibrio sp. ZSDZ42]
MSKQSGWVIVATEGATVDGRTITASWIKDMAEQYSLEEYTALIWPEHYRSQWTTFEGKNWGTVDEVKAEKKGGKLRLFAKITANQFLLDANKDGQKLFTSIEPNIDYRGTGRCYLMGLAVTDSPASSGTSRLKFSMGGKDCDREYSELEPLLFLKADTEQEENQAISFFKLAKAFFSGSSEQPTDPKPQPEDTEVTKEEMAAMFAEGLQPFTARLDAIEQKFTAAPAPATPEGGDETPPADKSETFNAEQFSASLTEALSPLVEKLNGLETQFNSLLQEAPNQRPAGEGADTHMEVI